jgi:hypothetical protein
MFVSHGNSGCNSIELYITLQPSILSQQSQIINKVESDEFDSENSDEADLEVEAEVNVIDEEEERLRHRSILC